MPSNVTVVVAGDANKDSVRKAVEKSFGDWKGGTAPKVEFPAANAIDKTRVIVAHRPKSVQSDIVVTQLLPDRHAASWPAVRVALQVLGGGLTGRLFTDVREKRSLAYSASASPIELAHDDLPLFAYAGTQTPKTADAVQGVIEDIESMTKSPPSDAEVGLARRYLSDIFAVRMETIGAIAGLVTQQRKLDLSDTYWDDYRAALRAVTTKDGGDAAARVLHADRLLVIVAGDADAIAAPLARFGEVTVVDPEHDFSVIKTLPKQ
jgi:predicted Zn-dependent peptidase